MPTRFTSASRRVALTIGSEVPSEDFGFSVHSTFGAAMNLGLAGRRFLVTVLGPESDTYPHGIRLSTSERFDSWPVAPGDPGRREGNLLVFEGRRDRRVPSIDLSGAVPSTRGQPPYIDPRDDSWWGTWRECSALLERLQAEQATDLRLASLVGSGSPRTPLGARLAATAGELTRAIRAGSADSAGHAAACLIGLGTGLTPTGDDFLCGLIAALWCASEDGSASRRLLIEWGAVLSQRLEATNVISATFLQCTIAGCFPGVLSAVAGAFQSCRDGVAHPGPRVSMERLCALGHSSGMDTATGFLFGLWIRTDEEMRRHAA